ncbi:beta-galactosidase [Pseudomonas sp. dw_358]|uniref:beta-galactosidase n=1 Tax=Pseudomonas sp. dw_358 TaxID=2720083 RepID=UPI001BD3ADB0
MCRLLPAVLAMTCAMPLLAATADQQTLFNFVRPTDTVQVVTDDTSLPQVNGEQTADGEVLRRVVFNAVPAPRLTLKPKSGNWDWSAESALTMRVQSAQDWAQTLYVTVQSSDGKTLTSRVDMPAGPAQTVVVPLVANSASSQGMRVGPPMPWSYQGQRTLLASSAGAVTLGQVASVSVAMDKPAAAQNVLIERFGTVEGDALQKAAYAELFDGYGQYTRGHWPEKIASDAQLKSAATKEQQQLKGWLMERNKWPMDRYGGLTKAGSFNATGFFHTRKQDGRWLLVTPDGHPFFSLGVNTVAPDGGKTYVQDREWMFTDLPTSAAPLARYYGSGDSRTGTGASQGVGYNSGRWFDFYAANLERTYGRTPEGLDSKRWERHSLDRLQGWGFNTVGNWSDPGLENHARVPYTLPLSIVGDYASISTGMDWWGRLPDPFDPRFAMAAERAVAIATRDHRDDPWLIGYFADNELAWTGAGNDPKARYALAYGTLRLTTDVPAKRAFLKQLRDKYRNQQGLSQAWGIDLPAWELMEDPGFEPPLPNPEHPQIEEDFKHFQRTFADAYFKIIADSLKWHDPNHLLLGGRFAASTPEAVASCAQYCDVLSFNFYTPKPQDGYDFAALKALDKPVMITEFHFGSTDRGPFWGGLMQVPRDEDRGGAYAGFIKAAVDDPVIVGAHWFQYLDEPASGRLLDGENGHFGLVGITDVPWAGFIGAVRKANLDMQTNLTRQLQPAKSKP